MQFHSPYLIVMNKSENISDPSIFPYGSIAVSAKEKLGIEGLKREIVKQFANEFLFCTLYIPYADTEKYAKEKRLLVERRVEYLDDGQLVHATIPRRYADTFTPYLKEIQQEK